MIDTQIESEPRFPWGSTLLSLAAAMLVITSIVKQAPNFAIGSIPLWTTAASLFLVRQRIFTMEVGEDGLDVRHLGQFIAYDSIEWLTYGSNAASRQATIRIVHDRGVLIIPALINQSSRQLFDFLMTRFQPRQYTPLPSTLQNYAEEQASTFGEDKVLRYVPRENVKQVRTTGATRPIATGLLVGGVAWFVAAAVQDNFDWAAGGIVLMLISLGFFLVGTLRPASPTAQIKNWKDSGLVITPTGLALIQGSLRGRLSWAELRDVSYNPGARSFQVTSSGVQGGIMLKVEGSSLAIADLYNQPLERIHEQIMKYWRGEP